MGVYAEIELEGVELSGERLVLRPWEAADAPRVHEVMQDRSMHDFLGVPDPYTEADAREFVLDAGPDGRADGTGLGCAVVESGTGRVVGAATLQLRGDPEIGFWTAPDARGHGYAAEATRLLAEFGFGVLHVPCIRLACDVRNVASARVALAAGFRYDGTVRAGKLTRGTADSPPRRGDLAWFSRLPGDPADPLPPAFPALPGGELTDGVVALRVLRPEDGDAYAETYDDLSQAIGFGGPPQSLEHHRAMAARSRLDQFIGGVLQLAVVDVETGRLAGGISMRKAGPPAVGAIGYGMHPDFRGRRYTSRALHLLAAWAFENGYARLELGAKVSNVASQRSALGGGFHPDGVREHRLRNPDGTFSDEARFALLPPGVPAAGGTTPPA